MDTPDLLATQAFNATSSPLQALRQVLTSLVLFIRLQRDSVIALRPFTQGLKPSSQGRLTKQEYMRTSLGGAHSETQQGLYRCARQLLGVIDQQVDLLTGQRQLDNLRHHAFEISALAIQRLCNLSKQCAGIGSCMRRNHHTLN